MKKMCPLGCSHQVSQCTVSSRQYYVVSKSMSLHKATLMIIVGEHCLHDSYIIRIMEFFE